VDGGRLQKGSAGGFFNQEKALTGPSTILAAEKLQRSLPMAPSTVHRWLYM
jgi:hypothetical protein